MKAGNSPALPAAAVPPDAPICVTSTKTAAAAANVVMMTFFEFAS
jgi:hypothetical protein